MIVVAPSPYLHSAPLGSSWGGTAGVQGVIIAPTGHTGFDANLDEPFGKLQELYEVVSIPVDEVNANPTHRRIDATSSEAGPTPEEVFAAASKDVKPAESKPPKKRPSPLEA